MRTLISLLAVALLLASGCGSPGGSARRARSNSKSDPGPKPIAHYDGSVDCVDAYLHMTLNDPHSLEYVAWGKPEQENIAGAECWTVHVVYRAKNGFGALMLNSGNAIIKNDEVQIWATDDEIAEMRRLPRTDPSPLLPPSPSPPPAVAPAATAPRADDGQWTVTVGEDKTPRDSDTSAVDPTQPPDGPAGANLAPWQVPPIDAADAVRRRQKARDIYKLGRTVDWRDYSYEDLVGIEERMKQRQQEEREQGAAKDRGESRPR